jgi:hypothetical protein
VVAGNPIGHQLHRYSAEDQAGREVLNGAPSQHVGKPVSNTSPASTDDAGIRTQIRSEVDGSMDEESVETSAWIRLTKSISLVCSINSLFLVNDDSKCNFLHLLGCLGNQHLRALPHDTGLRGRYLKGNYNRISSILVFDTIPILGFTAIILSLVGRQHEKLKFRIVGCAMIGVSVIVGLIFGPSIYIDPLTGIFSR